MLTKQVDIDGLRCGGKSPLLFIAGPCVIESERHCLQTAERLAQTARDMDLSLVFKASYDKANRSAGDSYRGMGLKKGLGILAKVKKQTGLSILTDVHCREDVDAVAEVADILQIPAFLCRQTDLIVAAARTGRTVNVKKGQFMAPWDAQQIVKKIEAAGSRKILLTERGASFGYNNLVSDMRSLVIMRSFGYPVIFDATHSVQLPGGLGNKSGGQREFVPYLTRAAVATGCDGLFMEVHEEPDKAKSDGPNALALKDFPGLAEMALKIDDLVKNQNGYCDQGHDPMSSRATRGYTSGSCPPASKRLKDS